MNPAEFQTATLNRCLDRLQAGDDTAYDDLIQLTGERLHFLARRLLRRFPAVRRWEDTQDVLQGAHLRLFHDLRDKAKRPPSVRDFFNLAANRVRSVLKDLHRHYQGPHGPGKHHASGPHPRNGEGPAPAPDPADPAPDAAALDRWGAFHEAVEQLDPPEREVVGLLFYHGWTQAQAAALLGVSDRTVRTRWANACVRLRELLGGSLPDF